jgi:class 3 adenylate cyclase
MARDVDLSENVMKILFVDDEATEYERFLKLDFAQEHREDIVHTTKPVGLPALVAGNPDLRLMIMDIRWGGDMTSHDLGMDALRDLDQHNCEVPIVVYSMIDNEQMLTDLLPEAERLGAIDWISKDEPLLLRDARFRRAYLAGTEMQRKPRSHGILARGETMRKDVHVAILFVDMSGFTLLTDQVGTAETVKILQMFYGAVEKAVHEHGGYVDKYIGDAVMAAFGAGRSERNETHSHVTAAVAAARAMLADMAPCRLRDIEPVLRTRLTRVKSTEDITLVGKLRVGIESGNVDIVRFERGNESEITFIGTAVNIAARILSQVEPGEIWLGENANQGSGIKTVDPATTSYRNLFGEFTRYRIPN